MSKSRLMKILITILVFSLGIMLTSVVLGTVTDIGGVGINPNMNTGASDSVGKIGNDIMGIIQVAGIIISVICIMVLGIKYMTGSAEEKAEFKKTLIPWLIGAVLLFAASLLSKTIYNWATQLTI